MEKNIKLWITELLKNDNIPYYLLEDFNYENSMDIKDYWSSEKKIFKEFSDIFDLNDNFTIKIIHEEILENGKNQVWLYVINEKNKVSFKMSLSIKNGKISSNDYLVQIVTKYKIENEHIKHLGMAIKTPKEIDSIISPSLKLSSLSKGLNYDIDQFYNVIFDFDDIEFNKTYKFFIKFKDGSKEKRVVFFDEFRKEDKPYKIENNYLILLDDKYPVNITIENKNGKVQTFVFPRNKKIKISNQVKEVNITDVLDNDWRILF